MIIQRVRFHSLTSSPPLCLIGLFAVGGGQTSTTAQSAEEAGLLRLLLLHPGDRAVSPRRRQLHPEEPLGREQPRPPHQRRSLGPAPARRHPANARQPSEQTLGPERVEGAAAADVSEAHEQEQQLRDGLASTPRNHTDTCARMAIDRVTTAHRHNERQRWSDRFSGLVQKLDPPLPTPTPFAASLNSRLQSAWIPYRMTF